MALAAPVDREFAVLSAGHIRDKVVLANFREGLRRLVNPETGLAFTEDEIQRATQPGSRWYVEAQALDDYGQGEQRGAIWLSDQIRMERASTKWLTDYHGRLWGEEKLPATGGSGPVTVRGVPGTIVQGSTTLGDPSAFKARDGAGNIFQVFVPETIGPGGTVDATMAAITTGSGTNPTSGTTLTWTQRDPNMEAQATVADAFTGGTDLETDAEYASRMANIARYRPGAGNDAHFRAWARAASNSVEDAFVYPCALYAGSTIVAITQKRGNVKGPLARVPNLATLTAVTARIVPPASTDVPPRAFVVVPPANVESCDVVLRLQMAKGSSAGWSDVQPFPSYHATTPSVTARTSDTDFQITCPADATLPGQAALATLTGANAPDIMVWNESQSEFVSLSPYLLSIQDLGSSVFRVQLTAGPVPIAVGQIVSPDLSRRKIVQDAVGEYFDELGPGELFDLATDPRGGRCERFPFSTDERPYRTGAVIATRVIEALGGGAADGTLASISQTVPTFPTNLTLGPNMLVAGTLGVYPL